MATTKRAAPVKKTAGDKSKSSLASIVYGIMIAEISNSKSYDLSDPATRAQILQNAEDMALDYFNIYGAPDEDVTSSQIVS